MMTSDTVVRHITHEKSHVVWYFIEHDQIVNFQATAGRKVSSCPFQTLQLIDQATCCKFTLYVLNREQF